MIQLAAASHIDVDAVSAQIPDNSARYHVFIYRHSHEGDQYTSTGMLDMFMMTMLCSLYDHLNLFGAR